MQHLAANSPCFAQFEPELFRFLIRRFHSETLVVRIIQRMKVELADNEFIAAIGNPRLFLSQYAIALGVMYLQDERTAPHKEQSND